MIKVSQFLLFINESNPQTTPVKLTLNNFLRGFVTSTTVVDGTFFNQFFNYCLSFPHWATNRSQLAQETIKLIEQYNRTYGELISTAGMYVPDRLQIFEIDNMEDVLAVTGRYFENMKSSKERLQLVNDQNKRVLAFVLHEDGAVSVSSVDRKFVIESGELRPLRDDLTIHYNSCLELSGHFFHRLEIAPYIHAQFQYESGRIRGSITRGFMFQRLQEWQGTPLEEEFRVLYPLKRIEQFFLDKNSDGFYRGLIDKLERTIQLLEGGDMEAKTWGQTLLENAQTAFELAFVDDRLLGGLIRHLRSELQSNRKAKVACPEDFPLLLPLDPEMNP